MVLCYGLRTTDYGLRTLPGRRSQTVNVLVIDVGGTNVKVFAEGVAEVRKFPSGPTLAAKQMVDGVLQLLTASRAINAAQARRKPGRSPPFSAGSLTQERH